MFGGVVYLHYANFFRQCSEKSCHGFRFLVQVFPILFCIFIILFSILVMFCFTLPVFVFIQLFLQFAHVSFFNQFFYLVFCLICCEFICSPTAVCSSCVVCVFDLHTNKTMLLEEVLYVLPQDFIDSGFLFQEVTSSDTKYRPAKLREPIVKIH